MVVGVNGVGKTTTIGKLAYQFKKPVIMLSLVQLIRFVPQQLINCKFGDQ
jgi:signal recognition particle GTPase